jgi:hypothetical protein
MNYDKTFGTTLELTPFKDHDGTTHDFINLSTNYGSGPQTPPTLCGPGADSDDCVAVTANIFYNVPVQVDFGGGACTFGKSDPPVMRTQLACTAPSCSDAYQHPTDPKQATCSSGGQRGYVVTYCPPGAPLPALPASP